jgi:hypothetical protein
MAEVTGELGGQPIILENAATETTLQLLVQAVNAANPNRGRAAQVQKMYDEALAKTVKSKAKELKQLQEEEKTREDLNKALTEETERRKKIVADLQNFSELLGRGVGAAFATATPKITDFTDALNGLPLVGPIFSALGRAAQGQLDAFRQLTSTGADLGGSLNDVRNSAAAAGLSLDDYVNVINANSETFARLTGNVSSGARAFREISGAIQTNFGSRLANLGFTIGEVSEFTAGYLEIQTKLGRAQRMNQTDLINGSQEYLLELDQLSRVTGLSRKEAQEALKQQLADKRVRTVMAGMDDRTRKEYQKTLAALEKEQPELADAFKELVATAGNPITDLGKKVALANPEFARQAAAFKQNRGNFDGLAGSVRSGARTLDGMGQAFIDTASVLAVTGKDIGTGGFFAFQGLNRFGEGAAQVSKEQQEAMAASGRSMASFDRALMNIRNYFMQALGPALQYFENSSSKFMKDIESYIQRFANWITMLIDKTEKEGLGAAIGQMFSDILSKAAPIIGKALFDLFTNPLVIASLASAIATASFVAGAAAKVGGGLADKLPGFGGGAASAGPARDPKTGRFVKGGAAQAPGAGLISGLIQGVGNGLAGIGAKAPLVLAGAAAIAGSITLIGAGIAGATWLMGKALPSLAEGMKSMEQLDGDKLMSAGGGMAALGAGLAAFSVTSLGSSVAGVFSSLTDGVASLFGAKSPIEKLREFAVVGNDLGKSAEGFTAFKLALTDMPLQNLSFTDRQLANLDLGTAKVRRLSASLTTVREEMKAISTPSITETVTSAIKDIGEAITSKLGGKAGKEVTVESLMTDLNSKVDRLNNSMAALVSINQNMAPDLRKTAKNTRATSGVV